MRKLRSLFVGFFSVAVGFSVFACSDDAEDDEARVASEKAALETKILETCNYQYTCDGLGMSDFERAVLPRDSGTSAVEKMYKGKTSCVAGWLSLQTEGKGNYTTYVDSVATPHPVTWKIEGARFEICDSPEKCVTCRMIDVPEAPAPAGEAKKDAKCTGSASSCYGRGAGSCGTQSGCYAGWHVRWNGNLEFECKGSSDSCSDQSTEASCKSQDGCRWQ